MSGSTNKRLRDLIREVRSAKTAQAERDIVAKESATIRDSFSTAVTKHRQRNVTKLMYIHMLGYATNFAQMEPIKLLSSQFYSDKRVGYLGLNLLLDEETDVLMLATNSIQHDLNHANPFIVGLALCSLANICNPGMARDLASDVTKLLSSQNPYIRKKAALCAIRIIRKVPELLEYFVPKIRPLLSEKHHGVLVTSVTLLIEMCKVEPTTVVKVFRPLTSHLVRTLKSLISAGYVADYDVGGITDPFLQAKIMHLLRILGRGSSEYSEQMNDVLAQVATNTEGSRNVGNAILYECVQTIMSIESEPGLRVLAITILGRFLSHKDNNIRYVALNTLSKFVAKDRRAVQQHRQIIVDCLKDPDISIRRRALDLVYLLVNSKNVRMLVRELLTFLLSADIEFRADLTTKICFVTEKFAPTKKWHIDTILRVLTISGDHVSDEVISNLVSLIISNPDLQGYAVQKMYVALSKDLMKQPLVQVGVWCIGEFGDILVAGQQQTLISDADDVDGSSSSAGAAATLAVTPADVIALMQSVLSHVATTPLTKQFVLTALLKLNNRLNSAEMSSFCQSVLDTYGHSISLEVQQRSAEFEALLKTLSPGTLDKLLLKVPPRKVEEESPAAARQPGASTSSSSSESTAASSVPAPVASVSTTPAAGGLLDLLGASSAPVAAPVDSNPLAGLFGGPGPIGVGAPAPVVPVDPLAGLFGTPAPAPTPIAADPLAGLFSGGASLVSPSPIPVATPAAPLPSAAPVSAGVLMPSNTVHPGLPGSGQPYVAYDKNGVSIQYNFVKNPDMPHLTLINSTIKSSNPVPLSGFSMLIAVPTFLKLQIDPPSSTDLLPGGQITQVVKLNNTLHGQKPLLLKVKVSYVANGVPFEDLSAPLSIPI